MTWFIVELLCLLSFVAFCVMIIFISERHVARVSFAAIASGFLSILCMVMQIPTGRG